MLNRDRSPKPIKTIARLARHRKTRPSLAKRTDAKDGPSLNAKARLSEGNMPRFFDPIPF
jgi:hypothetical protein